MAACEGLLTVEEEAHAALASLAKRPFAITLSPGWAGTVKRLANKVITQADANRCSICCGTKKLLTGEDCACGDGTVNGENAALRRRQRKA